MTSRLFPRFFNLHEVQFISRDQIILEFTPAILTIFGTFRAKLFSNWFLNFCAKIIRRICSYNFDHFLLPQKFKYFARIFEKSKDETFLSIFKHCQFLEIPSHFLTSFKWIDVNFSIAEKVTIFLMILKKKTFNRVSTK